MTYDYNKPSRVNVVSVLLLLIVAGGIYAGVKFIPVYWQGKTVDRELDELRLRAIDFPRFAEDQRHRAGDDIVATAVAKLHELGIEDQPDQPVQVWFTPEYDQLHARYQIIVTHPGNVIKPTVMTMERTVEVSR